MLFKLKIWHYIAFVVAMLILAGTLAYYFIPVVRYILIPVTGGTKAPESFGFKTGISRSTIKATIKNSKSFLETVATVLASSFSSSFIQASEGLDLSTSSTSALESTSLRIPELRTGILADSKGPVSSIHQVPAEGGWINSTPLDLQELRKQNKVVLIDFWTYSCINCIRATPYTQELWDRYKSHGLVVIGVHSPEFDFEANPENILTAIQKAKITYPVLTDAEHTVWKTFGNHFWPGKYLINPQGVIVYTQFGEGDYNHEEEIVRATLEKSGYTVPSYPPASPFLEPITAKKVTPELYAGLGFLRKPYGNRQQPLIDRITTFILPDQLQPDTLYLEGEWLGAHDYVQSSSDGKIVLTYTANALYPVLARAEQPVTVEVLLDGQPVPASLWGTDITERNGKTVLTIDQPRLYYPIAHRAPYGQHTITLKTPPGTRLYSFTFGAYAKKR